MGELIDFMPVAGDESTDRHKAFSRLSLIRAAAALDQLLDAHPGARVSTVSYKHPLSGNPLTAAEG